LRRCDFIEVKGACRFLDRREASGREEMSAGLIQVKAGLTGEGQDAPGVGTSAMRSIRMGSATLLVPDTASFRDAPFAQPEVR
jgi:hypothetical protein